MAITSRGTCTVCGETSIDSSHKCIGQSACAEVLETALKLTSGDRALQHGDKRQNHQNIADLWTAYIGGKPVYDMTRDEFKREPFTAHDVAVMMCLLKIARLKSGSHNIDNYVDLAGYAGIAAEVK